MAQWKISLESRSLFAEKLMDLGNYAVAGLVFGQFVSGHEISPTMLITGILFMLLCYIIGMVIRR